MGVLLVVYTLLSIAVGLGFFAAGQSAAGYIIDRILYPRESIYAREKEIAKEFERFLNDNSLTLDDRSSIERWMEGREYLIISTINGGVSFSESDQGVIMYSSGANAASTYELLQNEYRDYWYFGMINVRAAQTDFRTRPERFMKAVEVMYFPMYAARRTVSYICVMLGCAGFAVSLMLLVRRKTRYMSELSRQLSVMEGGDLDVKMQIRGRDELTTLAENIESMRLSFIERLKHEEEMDRSSRRLLTDMSHDLRTPLTALIGYLDIIQQGRFENEVQRDKYLASARARAYQIKEMTDELFEYFLVYSDAEELPQTEKLDASVLFSQMWEECAFSLEGFEYVIDGCEPGNEVDVSVKHIRRIMDNIVSNLRKYASKTEPVKVCFRPEGRTFVFEVSNTVSDAPPKAESSGIGLASCRKIAHMHGGRFTSGREAERFTCRLELPVCEPAQVPDKSENP